MHDQATQLRRLAFHAPRDEVIAPPRLCVLTGGKGGVGTTTVAVHLAAALVDQGARVVLVDADVHRADVTTMCGLADRQGVADVLAARLDIHEVLVRGPYGLQIVPGVWAPGTPGEYSERTQYRLLRQLRTLGRHADWALLDVGHGSPEVARRFWQAADDVVLVTTPDDVAVMDTYATVKSLLPADSRPQLRLLVNQTASDHQGLDVYRRIDLSCRRFLGFGVSFLGGIVRDPALPVAAQHGPPLLASDPGNRIAQQFGQIAARLLQEVTRETERRGASDGRTVSASSTPT